MPSNSAASTVVRIWTSIHPSEFIMVWEPAKKSLATPKFHFSARLQYRGCTTQDTQNGRTSHPPYPPIASQSISRGVPLARAMIFRFAIVLFRECPRLSFTAHIEQPLSFQLILPSSLVSLLR